MDFYILPNGKGGKLLTWGATQNIPWGLLLLFAGGMTVALAFAESGLSQDIGLFVQEISAFHVVLVLAIICLTVTFLTEMTSNSATTTLMMPILASAASHADPELPERAAG